jgi:hypothetical protein
MSDDLRLIANPYLIKKNNDQNIIHQNEDKLKKFIGDYYNVEIDDIFYEKIKNKITDEIEEYKLKKFIYNFVDECIQSAISTL